LKDENEFVREKAAQALQRIENVNEDIQKAATETLQEMQKKQEVRNLIIVIADIVDSTMSLNSEDRYVREAAARSLVRRIPLYQFGKENEVLRILKETTTAKLRIIGDVAIDTLVNILKDKDKSSRAMAAFFLGEMEDARSTELDFDSQKHEQVRKRLVNAVEPLIQALRDEYSEVRGLAAQSLANLVVKSHLSIDDPRVVEALVQTLIKGENSNVRWAAAYALAQIKDARAIEPLKKALKDKDKDVRLAAAKALEYIGDKDKD